MAAGIAGKVFNMATLTLDTHDFVTGLKEAGVPETQAEAIAKGLLKLDADQLVTKQDLCESIANLKVELFKWSVPLLIGQIAIFAGIVQWIAGD